MKTNRRNWIKISIFTLFWAGSGASLGYFFRDEIFRLQADDFAVVLRDNLSYLDLRVSDEQFDLFYELYIKRETRVARSFWLRIKGKSEKYYDEMIDKMVSKFLMSTDFFLNGADEAKPVRYVIYYDPYSTPCWNPLSMGASEN